MAEKTAPISHPPTYAPSWIDHFSNWIEGFPGPSWGYYAGIGAVLLTFLSAAAWIEGATPMGAFLPVHVFLAGAI